MASQQLPMSLPVLNFAIHRTELIGHSKRQRSSRDSEIAPVKVVPAFAPGQRAQKLQKRKRAGSGMQQWILRISPQIALKPLNVRAQVACVVRHLVFGLQSQL